MLILLVLHDDHAVSDTGSGIGVIIWKACSELQEVCSGGACAFKQHSLGVIVFWDHATSVGNPTLT